MYWLRRPPYLRWISACLLLTVGFVWETRDESREPYPFASESIAPGEVIDLSVDWRDIPAGLLPAWNGPVAGVAIATITGGDPLLPSAVGTFSLPPDWWSIAISLPQPAAPGTPIRLVTDASGATVEGILVESGIDDGFETIAMVAFAPADAPRVAAAASDNALVVMMGVPSGGLGGNG
jgi:hypothetical protein